MMEKWDTDYLRSREIAERTAAGQTSNDAARDAHLALAERYNEMAGAIDRPQAERVVARRLPADRAAVPSSLSSAPTDPLPWLSNSGRPKGSVRRI